MNDVVPIREVDLDRIRHEIESEKMIDRMEKDQDYPNWHFNLQDYGFDVDPSQMTFTSPFMSDLGFTDDTAIHFTMNCKYINQLISSLKMFRSRLTILPPLRCLKWHRDDYPRIHIPVWSHQGCFMVVKNKTHYLEPGQAYFVNTTNMHTAMNCNITQNRVHIIGSVHEILGQ